MRPVLLYFCMFSDGDLPEGETLHIAHSQGREACHYVREGDDLVLYTPDRSRVFRRVQLDDEDRAWLARSYAGLRSAAQPE